MRRRSVSCIAITVIAATVMLAGPAMAARYMENLGRGVVAVRQSSTQVFISWRLLGLDPSGIGFNLYRSTAGGAAVKLNGAVLTGGTNYTDSSADLTKALTYYVKPVIGGIEQAASGSFTLTANHATEPVVRIPLQTPPSGYDTKYVWVGDLDGDGEYDYVIDRRAPGDPNNANWCLGNQFVEAYKRDGTRLWAVDLGLNSRYTYNIEPGSSAIDVGHWDGVTVFDLDSDGKAEVMIRTANGVTFGDGTQLVDGNNNKQFISAINGTTGAERARIAIPQDYIADGPMGAQFGIGYLNGSTPSLVAAMKNRIGSGSFNMMICAWDFNGSVLTQKWKWLRGSQNCPDGHQMRILDVNGDGNDEVCEIGFVLKNDGTLLYNLAASGVGHGDRYHIGKFDPSRPGLQGYGIQQDNPSGLLEYYYDASNGQMLWTHVGAVGDVGRGMAADIDPRYPGYETWSFQGVYNGPSNTLTCADTNLKPYPCQAIWWDGDLLRENLNDYKLEKWDYLHPDLSTATPRILSVSSYGAVRDGTNPMFYGDIFGDWREEAVYLNSSYTELIIFTTNQATTSRIYTLAHNPAYRNGLTVKGYMQPSYVDYYLGDGMATPPVPDISLVGSVNMPTPDPMTWASVPVAAGIASVTMTATTATSSGGVEYYFTCTTGGGHDSAWQTSVTYVDAGLTPGDTYTYTVKARDAVETANETSASAPASATLGVYEAENALLSGAVVASNQSGYSGTGFADYVNATGDYVEWTVTADAAVNCELSFRYALAYAGTDRPLEIRVNGVVVAASLSFPATGSWAVWTMTSPLAVTLNTGTNTVRATAIGSSGGNVDYLNISIAVPDTSPPTPNPMTWFLMPVATSYDSIAMTAIIATDASGVEYYFWNDTITDRSHDSGWQDSPLFTDTGLTNNTTYAYYVVARDKSIYQNENDWSGEASATTMRYICLDEPDADMSSDCVVDLFDFAMFAAEYITGGVDSDANFNADSTVDLADLAVLAGEWLDCGREPVAECP